jgi:glyoxylase I family protein
MAMTPSRIFHVNVNCRDLERSLAFYRDVIGLRAVTRTAPGAPQPGHAFGLEQVQWDAWILHGEQEGGVVLDLLQWMVPPPASEPATGPTTTGFNRLCLTCPDLEAMHARLTAAGADCWSAPTVLDLGSGASARMFVCSDPDGTQLEFVEGPTRRLSHVAINCADFERSRRYYEHVVGLAPLPLLTPPRQPGAPFRLEGDMELRAQLFRDPASGFMVELVDWRDPGPVPTPPRRANDLGIFRMAWLTDDIDRDHAALTADGVACFSPPAALEMGPGIPSLRALFWADPDGACLELIEASAR